MKNRIRSVAGLCLLMSLGSAPFVAGNPDTPKPLKDIKLTLQITDGDSSYLPHLVAIEKGYFKEAGCNPVLAEEVSPEAARLPKESGLVFSESDMYLMGRTEVYGVEASRPGLIKAFNFNVQDAKKWNDAILVKKSSNISSLGQLKTTNAIGLFGGGPARIPLLKLLLKNHNLNFDDFKVSDAGYQKFTATADAVARKAELKEASSKVDIAYAREPFISLLMATGDWKILIDEPLFAKNLHISPWPMSMTLFSVKFLKENPALAEKIVTAYDKAIAFIRKHPAEAGSILSKYVEKKYGVKVKPRLVNYLGAGEISREIIQKQSDWYYENGITTRKIDAANILYPKGTKTISKISK